MANYMKNKKPAHPKTILPFGRDYVSSLSVFWRITYVEQYFRTLPSATSLFISQTLSYIRFKFDIPTRAPQHQPRGSLAVHIIGQRTNVPMESKGNYEAGTQDRPALLDMARWKMDLVSSFSDRLDLETAGKRVSEIRAKECLGFLAKSRPWPARWEPDGMAQYTHSPFFPPPSLHHGNWDRLTCRQPATYTHCRKRFAL